MSYTPEVLSYAAYACVIYMDTKLEEKYSVAQLLHSHLLWNINVIGS